MTILNDISEIEPTAAPPCGLQSKQSIAHVYVEPLGIDVAVLVDETLMAAARRNAVIWPSVCNGQGNCTVCYVKIEEGAEYASAEHPQERERLDFAGRCSRSFRLACQLKVSGPMRVSKKGVKMAKISAPDRLQEE